MNSKVQTLLKSTLVLLSYIFYNQIIYSIFSIFNINDLNTNWIYAFISDFIFFGFVFVLYFDALKSGVKDLKNQFGSKFKLGLKWLIISLIAQALMLILLDSFLPPLSENMVAVVDLNIIYMIFKTLFFSTIAEELVFKKSIRDVVSNKVVFIILSSILYGFMNIAYTNITSPIDLLNIFPYMVAMMAMCTLYVKTDNIVLVMLMNFLYNLIPLILMITVGI
ncbi:MAG: CPBP family glutamic-type intramembrane protease [Bacilli bacterium]|nr:CPBP family glutamic-type intramembrane protease [Bacilli bacterium]MDD4608083.1 CPBP family glutamic-type intramembrane protease [Bacilli bacterium]